MPVVRTVRWPYQRRCHRGSGYARPRQRISIQIIGVIHAVAYDFRLFQKVLREGVELSIAAEQA
jgi:hypothetical protein